MTTIRKATLEFTPDDHVTCWQKRDGERTLQVGEFEIDMPIDTARALHGELATGLGLACRPRSVQEQLAGHTRAALNLIADPALGDEPQVWTRVCVDGEDDSPSVSVHHSQQDAFDALRTYCGASDDVSDDNLIGYCSRIGYVARIDSHNLPATT